MSYIYFDNAATTLADPAAVQAAMQVLNQDFGNPSSLHHLGVRAHQVLLASRQTIADCLKAKPSEIIFNSGGTEGNNHVLQGISYAKRHQGKQIIVAASDHPSLLEVAKILGERGYQIDLAPITESGVIDLDKLADLINENTICLALHHVNNETGAIQPLAKIGGLLKSKAPKAHLHIDAVQSFAKQDIDLAGWQADSLALSGHKIHGLKGSGALWLKQGTNLPPLIAGGGQERNMRSGTENLAGIAALAKAAELAFSKKAANLEHLAKIRQILQAGLLDDQQNILNSPLEGAAQIINISFGGLKSEVLLHYLEAKSIYVSAGSACASHKATHSHVLAAMNLPKERLDNALRFSFCANNTLDEAKQVVAAVKEAVAEFRLIKSTKKGANHERK